MAMAMLNNQRVDIKMVKGSIAMLIYHFGQVKKLWYVLPFLLGMPSNSVMLILLAHPFCWNMYLHIIIYESQSIVYHYHFFGNTYIV